MKYTNAADRGGQVYSNLTDHSRDKPSQKWTAYLMFCCLVAALASFQFGYNIGVVSLPESHIKNFYRESFSLKSNVLTTTSATSTSTVASNVETAAAQSSDILQPPKEQQQEATADTTSNIKTKKTPEEERVDFLWVVTVCLFIVGGMIGAFSAKFVLDFFGRRNAIIVHNLFTLIGSGLVIASLYVTYGGIYVMLSRAFYGIQGGMSCSLIPTYLNEISPSKLRGATGVIHQLFITLGIVISQLLGFRQLLGTSSTWHFLLAGPVVPSLLCMVLLGLFCPETPSALLSKKGGDEKAKEALIRLRGSSNVAEEIEEITVELQDSEDEAISLVQLFTNVEYRWPLIVGLVLQLTQQFCGINAIFFYSGSIFKNANVADNQIQYAVLLTGIINVIMTIIVVPLIDRLGRKPLLVFPMIVIIIDFIALTCFLELRDKSPLFPYLSVVCVIIFIMCFALGLGPVPFIFCAEVFRTEAKSSALSVCMFTNWTANLILSLFFPYLNQLIGGYVFLVFLAIVVMSLVLIVFKMPETKGRKIDEILDEFASGGKTRSAGNKYNQYNRNENILMGNVRA